MSDAPALELVPYARGYVPRPALYTLWALMEAEGDTARVFAGQLAPAGTPHAVRGDLVQFVRMVDPEAGGVVTLIAWDPAAKEAAGLWWFSDLVLPHRASLNLWVRKRYRGAPAARASAAAVRHGFEDLGVAALWASTPWPEAARHAAAAGFTRVATLPGYCITDTGPRDVTVLRLTREEWSDGRR